MCRCNHLQPCLDAPTAAVPLTSPRPLYGIPSAPRDALSELSTIIEARRDLRSAVGYSATGRSALRQEVKSLRRCDLSQWPADRHLSSKGFRFSRSLRCEGRSQPRELSAPLPPSLCSSVPRALRLTRLLHAVVRQLAHGVVHAPILQCLQCPCPQAPQKRPCQPARGAT